MQGDEETVGSMLDVGGDVLARTGGCLGWANGWPGVSVLSCVIDAVFRSVTLRRVGPGRLLCSVCPCARACATAAAAPAAAVDENRRSALHFAAAMGKAALVGRLLARGAEVDLADKEGEGGR